MYKVENPFNPFLAYKYNDSEEMSYMYMKSCASFSEHARPSANDIILVGTEMDVLAVGNYVLYKENQDEALKEDYEERYELD